MLKVFFWEIYFWFSLIVELFISGPFRGEKIQRSTNYSTETIAIGVYSTKSMVFEFLEVLFIYYMKDVIFS